MHNCLKMLCSYNAPRQNTQPCKTWQNCNIIATLFPTCWKAWFSGFTPAHRVEGVCGYYMCLSRKQNDAKSKTVNVVVSRLWFSTDMVQVFVTVLQVWQRQKLSRHGYTSTANGMRPGAEVPKPPKKIEHPCQNSRVSKQFLFTFSPRAQVSKALDP